MSEEAKFVYEIKEYDPAVQEELTSALELLLKQKHGLSSDLKHGEIALNAQGLADQLLSDARSRQQTMLGSIAVQFLETGIKIADDAPIPYDYLVTIIETNSLYVLDFGRAIILFQKRDCIRGLDVSLPIYLAEHTGLHMIRYF